MSIFFKTIFTSFIWLLLIANLMIVFNIQSVIGGFTPVGNPNYSNSYVGFSAIVYMFKDLGNLPIGKFTQNVSEFYNMLFGFGKDLINQGIKDISQAWDDVNNMWDVLVAIFESIKGLFTIIASLFWYITGGIFMIIYFIVLIFNIFYSFMRLLSGDYFRNNPRVPQWSDFVENTRILMTNNVII